MAIETLQYHPKSESTTFVRFDVESLFYVAYYHFCTFYIDGGLNYKQPLLYWFQQNRDSGRSGKRELRPSKLEESKLLPEYRHLSRSLNRIRMHIYKPVKKVRQMESDKIEDLDAIDGSFNPVTLGQLFENLVLAAAQTST